MLRMVPLPRRFAAREDQSVDHCGSLILPCEAGEGDRPKDDGGGRGMRRTKASARSQLWTPAFAGVTNSGARKMG
jgi:hypothetical protein